MLGVGDRATRNVGRTWGQKARVKVDVEGDGGRMERVAGIQRRRSGYRQQMTGWGASCEGPVERHVMHDGSPWRRNCVSGR